MNRKAKRAKVVMDKVSPSMLRTLLGKKEEELDKFRGLLFAILREQRRVRLPRQALDQARQGDRLDVRIDDQFILIELVEGEETPGTASPPSRSDRSSAIAAPERDGHLPPSEGA
jgi:hypothetical protein